MAVFQNLSTMFRACSELPLPALRVEDPAQYCALDEGPQKGCAEHIDVDSQCA